MFNQDRKWLLGLVVVDIFVILIASLWAGPHSVRSDTQYFVNQIQISRGEIKLSDLDGATKDLVYYRLLKPLYGWVSVWPLGFISPENVILILNIIFLFGLSVSSYYFFRQIDFDEKLSFVGAVWVASGYPVLKYGLALVTDISGWFFAVTTITVFLYALKLNKISFLYIASIIGFLGSMSKETGVLGLMFCGLYLLLKIDLTNIKGTVKKLFALCVPFLVLQVVFLISMMDTKGPSLINWINYNYAIYFNDFYKIRYFITNEFLAFNTIWFFSFIGLIYCLKNKLWKDENKLIILIASLIPSVVILAWPVFYYRVLYVQFIFIIPLALYGVHWLISTFPSKLNGLLINISLFIPVLTSTVLYLMIEKY